MAMIINKAASEVLSSTCRAHTSRAQEPLLAPPRFSLPSRLRELVGGPLTLPEVFPVMALIFMAGYLLWCILGEPTLPFPWMGTQAHPINNLELAGRGLDYSARRPCPRTRKPHSQAENPLLMVS